MDPRTVLGERKGKWRPPAELERCRPREYRLTSAGRALVGLSVFLLVAAIAAGVVLHLKASYDHRERQAVMERGVDSRAEVTRRWKTSGKDAKYWVEYQYRIEDRRYTFKMKTGRSRWGRLTVESVLPVRYLANSHPHQCVHACLCHRNLLLFENTTPTLLEWRARHDIIRACPEFSVPLPTSPPPTSKRSTPDLTPPSP